MRFDIEFHLAGDAATLPRLRVTNYGSQECVVLPAVNDMVHYVDLYGQKHMGRVSAREFAYNPDTAIPRCTVIIRLDAPVELQASRIVPADERAKPVLARVPAPSSALEFIATRTKAPR